MNPFDILVVVIVAFTLIRGIFRGLVKELSSIIGVLAGFYAAYTYYPDLAAVLGRWISNVGYLNILSFLVIFSTILVIISILGVIIKYLLNIAFLGWMDRICGAGFGLIKGLLIVSILLICFTAFLPKGAPVIRDSLLAPHVARVSENLAKVVSKTMKQQFNDKLSDLKRSWKVS
jgi:membrane protein required for colicin V production